MKKLSLLILLLSGNILNNYSQINPSMVIQGPTEVFWGDDIIIYSLNDLLDKASGISWHVDSSCFEQLETTSSRSIKVKTKLLNADVNSKITVVYYYPDYTNNTVEMKSHIYNMDVIIKSPKIITSSNITCADNTVSFSLKDIKIPNGATITWTSGSYMILISGQGTQNAVFKTSGNGNGTVSAKITYTNGENYTIQSSGIWIGPPNNLTIKTSPYTKLYPGEGLELTAYIGSTIGSSYNTYTWSATPSSVVRFNSSTKNKTEVSFLNSGRITLKVTATNNCGSATASIIVNVTANGGGLQRSATLEVEETIYPTLIRVYSVITGLLVHTEKDIANFNIENTSLSSGIYIVETAFDNGGLSREKVMKKNR